MDPQVNPILPADAISCHITPRTRSTTAAALDTFIEEPLAADHPLWKTPNTIITPHLGGFCDVYIDNAPPQFENNLRRFLDGEPDRMINVETR